MILADDGEMYTFRVRVNRNDRNVKLENKWNILFLKNNFKDGDVIRFKFDKDISVSKFQYHVMLKLL
jgi:hypothetical protein